MRKYLDRPKKQNHSKHLEHFRICTPKSQKFMSVNFSVPLIFAHIPEKIEEKMKQGDSLAQPRRALGILL